MYLDYFRLNEKPFEYLIPDPRYYYYSTQGKNIKNQCEYIVSEKKGHLYISGPIGVGKTTLLKTLTQSLIADKDNIVNFINVPNLKTSNALMRRISEGFNVKTEKSYNGTLENFTRWLAETDRFPILVIDEGQNLVLDSLRTLHYLMTYVSDRLLMMIILCGQEDMAVKINNYPPLKSRMYPASLSSLTRKDAEEMLNHRWAIASQSPVSKLPFTKSAIDLVWSASNGVPRSMCQVADIALLIAYNKKSSNINRPIVNTSLQLISSDKKGKHD